MPILEFMGDHPILTIILALILTHMVVRLVQYLKGIPDPPTMTCPRCSKDDEEDE